MSSAVWGAVRGFFWPLGNFAVMLLTSPTKHGEFPIKAKHGGKATPGTAANSFASEPVANTLADHAAVQIATLQKLVWAYFMWAYFTDAAGARAWATGASADLTWLKVIVLRDLCITLYHAGFWDLVVYAPFSPFRPFLSHYKFKHGEYPSAARFAHDIFFSLLSTLISSLMEAALYVGWVGAAQVRGGAAPGDAWWRSAATWGWLLSMPYWRLLHFYCIHRFMHKWFPERPAGAGWCPDVGELVYKWVHSLHHRARNPTAWSGIAMHPVESSTYYTAMYLPLALAAALPGVFGPVHPIVMLYTKMDLTIAALVGHDGHGYPGGGSQAHWLHHLKMDCNYGENYAPMDHIFDTHAPTEDSFEGVQERRRARYGVAKAKST